MTGKRRAFQATPLSSGISLATAFVLQPGSLSVVERSIPPSRITGEIRALEKAVSETIEELRALLDSAGRRIGGPASRIFDAQLMIAGDVEFLNQVKEKIQSDKRNAGFVYNTLVQQSIETLKNSPNQYLRQMASDVDAVATKVLSHLTGRQKATQKKFVGDTALIGRLFTPGDVLTFRKRKATGLIAEEGGRNSHAALIARSLLVPMVVLPKATKLIKTGDRVIIDGTSGLVIVNPDQEEWADFQKRRRRQGPALISRIKRLPTIPPVTADGVEVTVAANLEMPGPADQILAERRLPVGLYRTEFLFLQNAGFPGEEIQFEYYERIAEQYARSHVILRVFDLGADKAMGNNGRTAEENPALGWRGVRLLLGMPEVFCTQIRAMMRASHRGNLKILLPMVSDIEELNRAHKLIGQVKLELDRKGVRYDKGIEVGAMVEVPAAALMAEQLARRADFVSIGTNDLAQYTMSADRSNNRVAGLYSARHPSVLKLIRMTVEAGRKAGKMVSICGEAAGDTLSLPLFIGMGVRYLSMNPVRIVDAARLVGKLNTEVVAHLVRGVMTATTVNEVTRRLESFRATLPK